MKNPFKVGDIVKCVNACNFTVRVVRKSNGNTGVVRGFLKKDQIVVSYRLADIEDCFQIHHFKECKKVKNEKPV